MDTPLPTMLRLLCADTAVAISKGALPPEAQVFVDRLRAILPVAEKQARTLAAHNAEADEQRDIDRRVATDTMRATDPDLCRPGRVPSAMTMEAERIRWERKEDGQGTNAVIARIAGSVGR
ncbi:MAG: hypothetical protein ACRYHQ_20130 [Janthinobacterium lividum]